MSDSTTLEKLNLELEKTEKKLRKAQNDEKALQYQLKKLTRSERTHRLCSRGGMLESYLPYPETITDEEINEFLKVLFSYNDVKNLASTMLKGKNH